MHTLDSIDSYEIQKTKEFIQQYTQFKPRVALVLGSGLSEFSNKIKIFSKIHSSQIPFYPVSTVQGHSGHLLFGYLRKDKNQKIPLLIFQGRVHYYEIESIKKVVTPVVLAHCLDVKHIIFTNASGGINHNFSVGDLMLIDDILNLSFVQLPRIKDRSNLHSEQANYFNAQMKEIAIKSALEIGISLHSGTYCWLKGPTYETPAEIQMLKRIGADAVGMSTVPEIMTAHALGMKILAISLISNLAAGISSGKLSHAEVAETGKMVGERFSNFMEHLILSLNC